MKRIDIGGYQSDEERWPEIHETMVDAVIRLEAALQAHVAKLPG